MNMQSSVYIWKGMSNENMPIVALNLIMTNGKKAKTKRELTQTIVSYTKCQCLYKQNLTLEIVQE